MRGQGLTPDWWVVCGSWEVCVCVCVFPGCHEGCDRKERGATSIVWSAWLRWSPRELRVHVSIVQP